MVNNVKVGDIVYRVMYRMYPPYDYLLTTAIVHEVYSDVLLITDNIDQDGSTNTQQGFIIPIQKVYASANDALHAHGEVIREYLYSEIAETEEEIANQQQRLRNLNKKLTKVEGDLRITN